MTVIYKYPDDFEDYDAFEIDEVFENCLETDFKNLTNHQKVVYCIFEFDRYVRNGGLRHYYVEAQNLHLEDTILGFNKIGALECSKLLETSSKFFPKTGIPTDRSDRWKWHESHNDAKRDANWNHFTELYYDYENPTIDELLWKYLKTEGVI